jgi:hypothetical protein
MIVDYSLEYYQDILSQVVRWRAIPLNLLQEMSDYRGNKTSFYRVIRNLQDRQLIKATNFNGIAKIVTPTPELAHLTSQRFNGFQEESLIHESIITMLCFEILTWEIFDFVKLPHEIIGEAYDSGIRRLPDAILEGRNQGKTFKMALEVEITRKSKTRVQNKVEDYLKNDVFDFIFYVFNDRPTFEAYQRFIYKTIQQPQFEEGRRSHEARFILGYASRIIGHKRKLEELEVFYLGKQTKLDSIFGKRRRDK